MIVRVNNIALLLFLFIGISASAQSFEQIYPTFIQNGQQLKEATVGGLSSPQFSEVDLNNDGILDLFIYDKIGGVSLTYINGGAPNQIDYQYAPIYQKNFPDLVEWVLLRDYNGDGIQDIFAYSSTPGVPGIEVYTGYYDAQNRISFQQQKVSDRDYNILEYPGSSRDNYLYVSNVDYPAIDDIDGDGDLDVVTFNSSGGIVELYENQSVERGFGLDSLIYILEDRCWGKFYESGIGKEVDLSPMPGECALNLSNTPPHKTNLHRGSTLLTLDLDNDGDKEVILGDVSFTNLNLVINGGSAENAYMVEQDIAFPSNDVPVDLPLFPAVFSLDIDNDGMKDLLVSPNLGNDIGETYEVVWFYKNMATNENPVYELQRKDLFVKDMIDFGTGAQPVFVDYNQDGLQDLVVGNKSFFVPGGMRNARVYLYLNTGTASNPTYELASDDLFNLNVYSQSAWRFSPTFGDLDGDGDLDALIGEVFGNLFYAENIAGAGKPFEFNPAIFGYQNIDVGQSSRPQIIDVDRDGLLDLVIGERNVNLNYFKNTGTLTNPIFSEDPTNNFFGKVDTRGPNQVTGYGTPTLLEIDGAYQLLVGTESGKMLQYTDLEGNLDGTFIQTSADFGEIKVGGEIHAAFADINNDGFLEAAIGNTRGGLTFFKTSLKNQLTSIDPIDNASFFTITPNPSFQYLKIDLPDAVKPTHLNIYSTNGQLLLAHPFANEIAIVDLAKGIYVLEVVTSMGRMTQKFVKE